jgi:putative endonuclease
MTGLQRAVIPAQSGIQGLDQMDKQPCVYLMASKKNGTLYVGITSDLIKRISQHKSGSLGGFTKRYAVNRLVWYELHGTMESAITREKRIKNWRRAWKLNLIEKDNPKWQDLYEEIR